MPLTREPTSPDMFERSPSGLADPPPVPPLATTRPEPSVPAPIYEPALPDPELPPAPVSHQLPEHKGKLARITDDLAGLSDDLKTWVELKIELVRAEALEAVEHAKGEVIQKAAAGVFAVLGVLFALITLGLGLGNLLWDQYWLGFLIVTALLFLFAFLAIKLLAPKPQPGERALPAPDPSTAPPRPESPS